MYLTADGLEVELAVLDLELGIQGDVAGGVGVSRAGEVGADRQMAPAARLDVLGVAGPGQQQESKAESGEWQWRELVIERAVVSDR